MCVARPAARSFCSMRRVSECTRPPCRLLNRNRLPVSLTQTSCTVIQRPSMKRRQCAPGVSVVHQPVAPARVGSPAGSASISMGTVGSAACRSSVYGSGRGDTGSDHSSACTAGGLRSSATRSASSASARDGGRPDAARPARAWRSSTARCADETRLPGSCVAWIRSSTTRARFDSSVLCGPWCWAVRARACVQGPTRNCRSLGHTGVLRSCCVIWLRSSASSS